jgi:predicted lipoprotein with Yx(FWY)xxD motif
MGSLEFDRRLRAAGHRRHRRLVGLLAVPLIGALALLPGSAAAAVLYPPVAGPAVKTGEGFELKGTVYDYGGTTTYHFEYGTTTEYGTSVPMPDADAGPGLATAVSEQITGLAPDTTYHYRLVSTNSVEGTGSSADRTFSTATTSTSPSGTYPGEPAAGGNPGSNSGAYPGGSSGSGGPTIGGSGPKQVAKTRRDKGRTMLTTTSGRTLYSLSAERHGRFICTATAGCTSIWHPLTIAPGVVPEGPVKFGTIRRPEGMLQVTYRGEPLYTFASDKKPGQAKGEGLKDVGTWHAVLVPTKSSR